MAIVYGLISGLLFGYVLQRSRLCFNSAFRDLLLEKDNFVWKTGIFALALQMILFPLMAQFGLIKLAPPALNWVGVTLGALLFGLGMVLGGGCASGTTYRVGEGNTTSWFAALFFAITGAATAGGFLAPLRSALVPARTSVASNSTLFTENVGPNISTMLGVNPLIPSLIIAVLLIVYVFATKTSPRPEAKWPWWLSSILVTIVAGFAYWSSTQVGRNFGLGITGGWIGLMNFITGEGAFGWFPALIVGTILGAFITALATKEFKLRVPRDGKTFVTVAIGGMLMGFGAVLAGGCNIGHFLTGVPLLAISSIVASVFFILGNWAMTWFMYMRE
jgi:uncharacterized membrane protein YedE/YeeE